MRSARSLPRQQRGALLILLVIALGVLAVTLFVGMLSSSEIQIDRDKKTAAALAEAKAALIGYAARNSTRPGWLPCPDYDGDGKITVAGDYNGSACNTYTGRLPWKSLGLPDLRDGYGEELWYAVSVDFHASGNAMLNSDTPGQLSIGGLSPANNVIAIVLAPGPALAGQLRDATHANDPANYLEGNNALGGANTSFTTANGSSTFNDRLLPITNDNLFPIVEKRVVKEVVAELNNYFSSNRFFPKPAAFSDTDCLGNTNIISPACPSSATETSGRIPANPATPWISTSILVGTTTGNWFQKNGWRELIYYAPDTACVDGTNNCSNGTLKLITRQGTLDKQKAIVVSAGSKLTSQNRNNSDKTNITNYFEDENSTPLDNIYSSISNTPSPFNDFGLSIP